MILGDVAIWQLILIVPIGLIVVLALVAFTIRIIKVAKLNKKAKKPSSQSIDYSSFFGGKENIISSSIDSQRISVEVKDVNICNLDGLKENGAKNIMIVGSTIKVSFENADKIIGGLK